MNTRLLRALLSGLALTLSLSLAEIVLIDWLDDEVRYSMPLAVAKRWPPPQPSCSSAARSSRPTYKYNKARDGSVAGLVIFVERAT